MAEQKDKAIVQQPDGVNHPVSIMASRLGVDSQELYKTLTATVMKPGKDGRAPSREEVTAFAIVANKYQLDPFKREIHAFADPQRGGIVPIVGIDGWSRIVNSHPQFDGCTLIENHDEDGALVSVTCTMHVKDRSHPVAVTEYLSECRRNTTPWSTMPRRMLRHKAYMQAARLAFSLSGIFDEDEGEDIAGQPETIRVPNTANRTQALAASLPSPPMVDADFTPSEKVPAGESAE